MSERSVTMSEIFRKHNFVTTHRKLLSTGNEEIISQKLNHRFWNFSCEKLVKHRTTLYRFFTTKVSESTDDARASSAPLWFALYVFHCTPPRVHTTGGFLNRKLASRLFLQRFIISDFVERCKLQFYFL